MKTQVLTGLITDWAENIYGAVNNMDQITQKYHCSLIGAHYVNESLMLIVIGPSSMGGVTKTTHGPFYIVDGDLKIGEQKGWDWTAKMRTDYMLRYKHLIGRQLYSQQQKQLAL